MLIVSTWAESLSNRPIIGRKPAKGFITPGVWKNLSPIKFVNVQDASSAIQDIFSDIMEKHRAFDVASDFRALAKYPMFLSDSWNQLRNYVGTEEYNRHIGDLKEQSILYAHQEMS